MRPALIFALLALALGCQSPEGGDARSRLLGAAPAKCETDQQCGDGFTCQDNRCLPGERSATERAALQAAEAKKAADEAALKAKPKEGEGRLIVRICPGFKNTPEAIGTLIATHQETKQRHLLHMAMEAPDLGWQMEFTFRSLPLGVYDVTADYGIQKGGVPDVVRLPCDKKAPKARPCREDTIREMTVVPPEKEAPREKNEKGEDKLKDCDFIAE